MDQSILDSEMEYEPRTPRGKLEKETKKTKPEQITQPCHQMDVDINNGLLAFFEDESDSGEVFPESFYKCKAWLAREIDYNRIEESEEEEKEQAKRRKSN